MANENDGLVRRGHLAWLHQARLHDSVRWRQEHSVGHMLSQERKLRLVGTELIFGLGNVFAAGAHPFKLVCFFADGELRLCDVHGVFGVVHILFTHDVVRGQ